MPGSESAAEDDVETSVFYQSVMSWKHLQEWAQRVWAKHYQQSPDGSTQNVKPVIVEGGLSVQYMTESSPADQSALTNEAEADNLPTNQHAVPISQYSAPANRSKTLNVTAQPANQSTFPTNQKEVSNVVVGRGSVCCRGDGVNKLNIRSQPYTESPIERDLLEASQHRDRTRLEQNVMKNCRKSRCMFTSSFVIYLLISKHQSLHLLSLMMMMMTVLSVCYVVAFSLSSL